MGRAEKQKQPSAKTTAIYLPYDLWALLRQVAAERQRLTGERASASAIIVELIEQNKDKLVEEAGR